MDTTTSSLQDEREHGLDLLAVVKVNRGKLVLAFLGFALAGYLIAAFLMRPAYRAETVVMPRETSASGMLAGLVGGALPDALGGLLKDQGVDKNVPLQTIVSTELLRSFLTEHGVIRVLCAEKAVDCNNAPGNPALNDDRAVHAAVKLFRDHILSIDDNQLTGVVHISVIWYDRKLAADWCNELIEMTNLRIQKYAADNASMRVRYLKQEYGNTPIVPLQAAIGSILTSELTKQVDAATRPDFAWRVLDHASPPDDRRPARPLKSLIASVVGLMGVLILLAILAWRSRRHPLRS
jgi:capsular polysaccharide biosynthesis protein